jgi:hypothetical protein
VSQEPDVDALREAGLHFKAEFDRLCRELRGTRYGYLTARGCISDARLKALRVLAEAPEPKAAGPQTEPEAESVTRGFGGGR